MPARFGFLGMDALKFLAQCFDVTFRQGVLDNKKTLAVELVFLLVCYRRRIYAQFMQGLLRIHGIAPPNREKLTYYSGDAMGRGWATKNPGVSTGILYFARGVLDLEVHAAHAAHAAAAHAAWHAAA
jgi:hypothetical protein